MIFSKLKKKKQISYFSFDDITRVIEIVQPGYCFSGIFMKKRNNLPEKNIILIYNNTKTQITV